MRPCHRAFRLQLCSGFRVPRGRQVRVGYLRAKKVFLFCWYATDHRSASAVTTHVLVMEHVVQCRGPHTLGNVRQEDHSARHLKPHTPVLFTSTGRLTSLLRITRFFLCVQEGAVMRSQLGSQGFALDRLWFQHGGALGL